MDKYYQNLDWAQISYALKPHRIFFVDKPACWSRFYSASHENMDKYYQYTPDQLCKHFLERVLAHIDSYDLEAEEMHTLGLLNVHPNYRRTENGFVAIPEQERIDFIHATSGVCLMDCAGEDLNRQLELTRCEHQSKHQLSAENAGLLSIALSSDVDLAICERLLESEMLKRLRGAKRLFHQTGEQLKNVNIIAEDLMNKLQSLLKLKKLVLELVKKDPEEETSFSDFDYSDFDVGLGFNFS